MFKNTFTVPTANELNPRLAELLEKRMPIGKERSELRQELLDLSKSEMPYKAQTSDKDRRVAKILGSTESERKSVGRQRMDEINERMRDLDAALEILDREIETERSRTTALMRERVMPEYRKRIGELAKALVSVHTAVVACEGLKNRVGDEASCAWMAAHCAPWLERGRYGAIGIALHEAKADGMLPESAIPLELRD